MSKRSNKRQMRELEESQASKAVESSTPRGESEGESEDEEEAAPAFNPFAALEGDEPEPEEEEEEEAPVAAKKKNKKKKNKKKKKGGESAASTPAKTDELEGLDEVDRALAESKSKYGEDAAPAPSAPETSESRSASKFRNSLSVDPKNLDADAESRRFFGSKVIASADAATPRHRGHARMQAALSKMRYTLAKPKATYPPPTSSAGLNMHEMADEDVADLYDRRGWEQTDPGEKWYTFEHSPAWREIERQFSGAVRSHDPNELMASSQVYPWHVDTLSQMSEVYRSQNDIGAASDFAERASYAFDRCLVPGFNVQSGACRLDFDYVENRPMFTASHRIIGYLGRRGCWATAFSFAKVLFALDPEGDPHGAASWLDFSAVKSGNGQWLLDMSAQRETSRAAALWHGYPGMGWNRALASRQKETAEKDKEHAASTAALVQAMKTFPEVIVSSADKINANIPAAARQSPLTHVEAGYSGDPSVVIHLSSHIYVARNEASWKEPAVSAWFEKTVRDNIDSIDDGPARAARAEAHAIAQTPRDLGADGELAIPLNICRHVSCSESTSWLGFLPPSVTSRPFHAYDPSPPSSAQTAYDAQYFDPVARVRGAGFRGAAGGQQVQTEMSARFLGMVRGIVGQEPGQWPQPSHEAFQQFAGRAPEDMPVAERAALVRDSVRTWEEIVAGFQNGEIDFGDMGDTGGGDMPGAFP